MKALRILFAIVLIAAASLGGFVLTGDMVAATDSAGDARGRGPTAVRTAPAQTLRFAETVEAVGTARAREAVVLHPLAAGRVTEIAFAPGQPVATGDVLLRLDDAEARANLTAAEATLAETRGNYARLQGLARSGSATEANLEAARAAMLRAEAAQALAQKTLEDRSLTAPFAGVVGFTDLARGQLVDSASVVTTLDDLSVIEVAFSVPERYLSRLQPGLEVRLTSAAWPDRSFTGTISGIDTRIDETTRSIALRAKVPNDDRLLTAGMFLRAALVLDERDAPAVPERALSVSGAQTFVHLNEGGIARRLSVTTGRLVAGMIEITSALPEGAQVITSNLSNLSDGAPVQATAEIDG
ncbi:efflux RND transporter periplasmic adaptor subunit [Citreicella sp. C3M06]|uniref:efflux RND transporter periplasmic adaptor subunit n=1 Tax=Citreicella sp. C3M06 TaxID=2841564 RepID=UPI001C088C4B|nr:efflux RND transporter periplasmic adaptor subunit [Citreicella sp. C3M06]MBU2959317.1 efflux RND transporter periplasmic adaptor subunit [Citreicella sp. C3M06]